MHPCRKRERVCFFDVLVLRKRSLETFANGAQTRQKEHREGAQQQQTIPALRVADAKDAHAHAETQVLGVAEGRPNGPPLGAVIDSLPRGRRLVGDCQTPGLPHVLGLEADDAADPLSDGGDLRPEELGRAAVHSHLSGGALRLAAGRGELDVAAESDDIAEPQSGEKVEQLGVAEAAIRQDRDGDRSGKIFAK